MDEKIDVSLKEMATANRIQIEKIDVKRGVLFGKSIPFQANAYIFVSRSMACRSGTSMTAIAFPVTSSRNVSSSYGTSLPSWDKT